MLNVVVDLSHWNSTVNFPEAAQGGVVGVIHKATQGLADVDPLYATRQPAARAAGLLWGAYHFGTNADGAAQAEHFLSTAHTSTPTLMALDFEQPATGAGMTTAQAEAFVEAVFNKTGQYPGFYSTHAYLTATGADRSTVLANCWLWLADYNPVPAPTCPPAWRTWTLWQYTDGRHGNSPLTAPGIGACDRDIFNGQVAGLHALWGVQAS